MARKPSNIMAYSDALPACHACRSLLLLLKTILSCVFISQGFALLIFFVPGSYPASVSLFSNDLFRNSPITKHQSYYIHSAGIPAQVKRVQRARRVVAN